MSNIRFCLIIFVIALISYLDYSFNMNGFLLIFTDLLLIFYFSDKSLSPKFSLNLNINLLYVLIFTFSFYTLYNSLTSIVFIKDNLLRYEDLSNYEITKALILYPILEELVFRKYLLSKLTNSKTENKSIVFLSLGFTLTHFLTDSALLYVFLFSVFLSWIYLKTRNIYLCIASHILNNFLALICFPMTYLGNTEAVLLFVILLTLTLLIIFTIFKIANFKTNKFYNEDE
jgi:membrane protease YdiL (CAAX protease family)